LTDINELLAELQAEEEKTRAFAAEDIAYDGLTDAIPALIERLVVEESRFVREVIVQSLKIIGEEVIPGVISLLHSDDAFVRNAAIDILSVHDGKALNAIENILNDEDKDIRKFALDILRQLGTEESADLIAQGLEDADINNQITAVEYLGQLEYKDVNRINNLLTTTDNVLLRCTCLEALAVIGNDESLQCVARLYPDYASISPLEQYSYLKFVAAKGSELHLALIASLIREKGQVMHKEIINAIEGILHRRGGTSIPAELLGLLADYLNTDLNAVNKYELLVMLGRYKNDEIFPLLIKHLAPAQPLVCLGAIEALGTYGRIEARPWLLAVKSQISDEEMLDALARSLEQLK
jgi:HEAT repeat protein